MTNVRELQPSDVAVLERLAAQARGEGFQFLNRLREELHKASTDSSGSHGYYLVVELDGEVLGVGGVTEDPYLYDRETGRIRHVYVAPHARRQGCGRMLLAELEERAWRLYKVLRLRTDTAGGARFYEALGYEPVTEPSATHVKQARRSL